MTLGDMLRALDDTCGTSFCVAFDFEADASVPDATTGCHAQDAMLRGFEDMFRDPSMAGLPDDAVLAAAWDMVCRQQAVLRAAASMLSDIRDGMDRGLGLAAAVDSASWKASSEYARALRDE